jgi:hypothetical protein
MKDLTREAILRMVGLHDAAHMMRQMNAIQLSLEEEQGRMVAYGTEIRKSEKEVTLLAGRVAANETNIGQLQVTAQQLTASVSSLTTTVNGHTTSIGQLQITANSLTASVSSLDTTVSGHTTSIGQLQVTANSISNRVTVIEGDYVKEAQISLMVVKDGNGYISNALIDADDIDFVFTRAVSWYWQNKTEANKRMGLDSSGNLWISGELRGGSIQGNYTIGTQGTKMQIYVDETVGSFRSSGIRGRDTNNAEVIRLGMLEYGNRVEPSLRLNDPNVNQVYVRPEYIQFQHTVGSVTPVLTFGWSGTTNKVLISAPVDSWPSLSNVSTGQVYLDNGYLRVRTS